MNRRQSINNDYQYLYFMFSNYLQHVYIVFIITTKIKIMLIKINHIQLVHIFSKFNYCFKAPILFQK